MMEELIKLKDRNIIVITGRDNQIKPKFNRYKKHKNVKIIGWTDQMPNFIKSADLVATKAGGATVMECIAAQKPIIVTSTLARHESGNAELIKNYHLGIIANARRPKITQHILSIRENYQKIQKNLKKVANPDAALKIAAFLAQLLDKTNQPKIKA